MIGLKPRTVTTIAVVGRFSVLIWWSPARQEAPGRATSTPTPTGVREFLRAEVGEPGGGGGAGEGGGDAVGDGGPGRPAAECLLPARRRLVDLRGALPLAARPAARVAARAEDERDDQDQQAQRDVEGWIDGVLGAAGDLARAAEREHDHEAERDARQHRAEQVAEQQPFRARQHEHDRGGGQQRGVERGRDREDKDLAQGPTMTASMRSGITPNE